MRNRRSKPGLTVCRSALVRRLFKAKQREHPELRAPTFEGLLAVLDREGIIFVEHQISYEGKAFDCLGTPCIIMNPSSTRRLYVLLHEYAHCCLHVFDKEMLAARAAELNGSWIKRRSGSFYITQPSTIDARIEEEADLFAELALAGAARVSSAEAV